MRSGGEVTCRWTMGLPVAVAVAQEKWEPREDVGTRGTSMERPLRDHMTGGPQVLRDHLEAGEGRASY